MSSNWGEEPAQPATRPPGKVKNDAVYVRKVRNGFLLETVRNGQIFVVHGDGSENDIEEMLKAVRMVFEE